MQPQFRQYTNSEHANYIIPRTLDSHNYIPRPADENWHEAQSVDQASEVPSDTEKVHHQEHGAQPAESSTTENRHYTEKEESAQTNKKTQELLSDEPRYIIVITCVVCFTLFLLIIISLAAIRCYYKNVNSEPHWRERRINGSSTFDPLARGWYYGNNNFTHR